MKTLLLSWILFLTIACGGTNIGNPTSGQVNPEAGHPTSAEDLGQTLCQKIASCYGEANATDCTTQVMAAAGFTSELGALASTYSTLNDLKTAEPNQAITVDSTQKQLCRQKISALSCSESLVQSSYSTTSPTDYTETHLLFRADTACAQMYY